MLVPERRSKRTALFRGLFERLAAERHVLDQLAVGVIVVDAEANEIFVNEEASVILNKNDGLSIAHGRLAVTHTVHTRGFLSALTQACREGADATLLISRPSGRRAYQCVISPMDDELKPPKSKNPLAVIFLTDPERIDSCRAQFASLYCLTPQEAHLAEIMVQGESLERASERMGVRKSTARAHLKHLMQKVDAHRQGELISILLKAPPVRQSNGKPNSNTPGPHLTV